MRKCASEFSSRANRHRTVIVYSFFIKRVGFLIETERNEVLVGFSSIQPISISIFLQNKLLKEKKFCFFFLLVWFLI